ncbi:hypothetical protein BG003_009609 [Podila horticola]|nr:hypothetical protein BG003_009609 [Podila horticola]
MWKTEQQRIRGLLAVNHEDLQFYAAVFKQFTDEMRMVLGEVGTARSLLAWVISTQLDNSIFHALTESHVYVRDNAAKVVNLENFYLTKREYLENLDNNTDYDFGRPIVTSVGVSADHIDILDITGETIETPGGELDPVVTKVVIDLEALSLKNWSCLETELCLEFQAHQTYYSLERGLFSC